MPSFSATAPGKAILFGEHAVVYGQPAIAIPLFQIHAKAVVSPQLKAPSGSVFIAAPAVGINSEITSLPGDQPLRKLLDLLAEEVGIDHFPACRIDISSTIPVASGLGSGAAISVAVIRALTAFLGFPLADARVSALAFEVEKIYHGTPSGIDNTVITFGEPILFQKGQPYQRIKNTHPFIFIIANSGIKSPTAEVVARVRKSWQKEQDKYEKVFHNIGAITLYAFEDINKGNLESLGARMNLNEELLAEIGISTPETDRLVDAALQAGAYGAKISGAGQGGNIIALIPPDRKEEVSVALHNAGAVEIFTTTLQPSKG